MSSILKYFISYLFFSLFLSTAFSQGLVTTSNLPFILINTNGQSISDSPKIIADMGIIWNGEGKTNNVKDLMNNYNGKIGIEIRGSSSQMFPKKSYGIETKSNDLLTTDFSLLGMPEENDWVLYAPYTDKTMIRDVLTYTLDAGLGHWSPRCRYVELFLNGNYEGVYVLMEKIKRNKNRVDIAKLTTSDNVGNDLTGGYIIKIDKTTGTSGAGWYSSYPNTSGNTYYQHDYPKPDVITSTQRSYIKDYVKSMEMALYQDKFTGPGSYHDYLNDSSFVDFMIVNELAKNVDGYRLSSYLYKAKNNRLNCGPIWDFNLGYGNADYFNGWSTYGFQYQSNLAQPNGQQDNWQNPFWWNKLMTDQAYEKKLTQRWNSLRSKQLTSERITFVIDSLVNLLSEAQVRNYQRWPILGQKVWPNYYVGNTYISEINWMKDWITNRLYFLDHMWPDKTIIIDDGSPQANKVFPNPFSDQLTIQFATDYNGSGTAEIFSTSGSLLRTYNIVLQDGKIELGFSGKNNISRGLYVLRIIHFDRVLLTQKIMKR